MRKLAFYQKIGRLILAVGIVSVLSSCSPEYIPNMVNSPIFTNAGEFQATVAVGRENLDFDDEVSLTKFNFQTAAAITNHIGIMINGSYGNDLDNAESSSHEFSFIEAGIGYYNTFKDKYRYEIYGGYGVGKTKGYYGGLINEITDVRYDRYFIQPGMGFSKKIFDGSFSPRIVLVQMERLESGSEITYNTFFEPVFTSKIGYKHIKFIVQGGLSVPIGSQELNYDHQHFIFNFGLNFNIGRKYFDF